MMRAAFISFFGVCATLARANFVLDSFSTSQGVALSGPSSNTIAFPLLGSRALKIELDDPYNESVVNPGATGMFTIGSGVADMSAHTEYGANATATYSGSNLVNLSSYSYLGLEIGTIQGPTMLTISLKDKNGASYSKTSPVLGPSNSNQVWGFLLASVPGSVDCGLLSEIGFTITLGGGINSTVLKRFSATNAVPEPTTLAGLATGLVWAYRRRRKVRASA